MRTTTKLDPIVRQYIDAAIDRKIAHATERLQRHIDKRVQRKKLTDRQKEYLNLFKQGKTKSQVAYELHVTPTRSANVYDMLVKHGYLV